MDAADHWHLRGLCAAEDDDLAQAASCLGMALGLRPEAATLWADLGACLHRLGQHAEAETVLRRALRLQPDMLAAQACLGLVLAAQGQHAAAVAALRAVLDRRPDDAAVLTNLGNLLVQTGALAAAEELLRRVVALRPDAADARHNLAVALAAAGRLEQAEACCLAAQARDPAHAEAAYTLGMIRLLDGRLAEGWPGFARRWQRRGAAPPRRFDVPAWNGGELAGRVLLLHAEQGLGDAIQMLRYLPRIAGRVVLEVPAPLLRWARALPGAPEVALPGAARGFALQCSLMDLPGRFATTLASIPPPVAPRIAAGPWAARLQALPGRRVGLAWAGNPHYAADARRSLPAACLGALAGVPGVSFVSLQTGATAAPPLALHDWTGALTDLAETAALVQGLDLVIAADSAVAHLAATLGRPVWLLNRFDTCWRWLRARSDSPWYPSLRIFRQSAPGDWDGVLEAVADALSRPW